jgi:hypothetical protein
MQNEIDIVRDVSARLELGGLSYMLTGSMAMNYYATPRMTRDIDVVIALVPGNVEAVLNLFTPDYYISTEEVVRSIMHESIFNLIHQESIIKVDCIVRKNSPISSRRIRTAAARDHQRFLHLDCEQGRLDYIQALVGERLAFRNAI